MGTVGCFGQGARGELSGTVCVLSGANSRLNESISTAVSRIRRSRCSPEVPVSCNGHCSNEHRECDTHVGSSHGWQKLAWLAVLPTHTRDSELEVMIHEHSTFSLRARKVTSVQGSWRP